jgi:hypothetical protein
MAYTWPQGSKLQPSWYPHFCRIDLWGYPILDKNFGKIAGLMRNFGYWAPRDIYTVRKEWACDHHTEQSFQSQETTPVPLAIDGSSWPGFWWLIHSACLSWGLIFHLQYPGEVQTAFLWNWILLILWKWVQVWSLYIHLLYTRII